MAVYKQSYSDYQGRRTPGWARFLVLTHFSYARLFQSRFLVLFMATCAFFPFGCAVFIYISHNSPLLEALQFRTDALPPVDGRFFYLFAMIQGSMAFFLTILVGPSLIAPDLANGAMPLYLSRPFARAQYILGKMCVLVFLLSLVTWVPGLLLYFIQVGCVGWQWLQDHLWLAGSIVLGLGIWIILLALLALALSAWVKYRIAAGALILGVFFLGAGFGELINEVMHTEAGSLLNLSAAINTIWAGLFRHHDHVPELTVTQAWSVMAATAAICLAMLAKRVRAFEVVK